MIFLLSSVGSHRSSLLSAAAFPIVCEGHVVTKIIFAQQSVCLSDTQQEGNAPLL